MTTEMLSPEWRKAAARGCKDAEQQLGMIPPNVAWHTAVARLREGAADMVRHCWETDRGWTKFAYYNAMQNTYQEALEAFGRRLS